MSKRLFTVALATAAASPAFPAEAQAAACVDGDTHTVAISRKVDGERVVSTRVNANGPVRLDRRDGRLYAVVDIRDLSGKTMVLRISRRTESGELVKTKYKRRVCE